MKPGRLGLAELATLLIALTVLPLAMSANNDQPPHVLVSSAYQPPQKCTAAQQAIGAHRRAYTRFRHNMNLTGAVPRVWYQNCQVVRRRASEWRHRAHQAKAAYQQWHGYQYNWRSWLPRGWYGIGSCETGYGGDPNWQHNSGTYQGAFGFAVSSWDAFVSSADPKAGPYPSEAYLATPRQQYEVALAIYRRYGLSGWGCRGAYYR